jgi:hypothetical protein
MAHLREHSTVQYDLNHKDRVKAFTQKPSGICSTHIYSILPRFKKQFAMLSYKLQNIF